MGKNWETPPKDFQFVLFEQINPECNEARYYYLAWAPTLLGPAVIRMYGRKGASQTAPVPIPFDSLAEAWPTIRKHIKARLRHGYCVVQPDEYVG